LPLPKRENSRRSDRTEVLTSNDNLSFANATVSFKTEAAVPIAQPKKKRKHDAEIGPYPDRKNIEIGAAPPRKHGKGKKKKNEKKSHGKTASLSSRAPPRA